MFSCNLDSRKVYDVPFKKTRQLRTITASCPSSEIALKPALLIILVMLKHSQVDFPWL